MSRVPVWEEQGEEQVGWIGLNGTTLNGDHLAVVPLRAQV